MTELEINLYKYEEELQDDGINLIAGVDEAGRGPLAGPVVVAACILPPTSRISGLNDSKQLSKKKRESLYNEIIKEAICYKIVLVSP
jgi:ribonuclease HII